MDYFNNIAGWASIISFIMGLFSVGMSTYAIKQVNKYTDKSKDINKSKVKVGGKENIATGRDYNGK